MNVARRGDPDGHEVMLLRAVPGLLESLPASRLVIAVVGAQPSYGNTSVSYPVPAEANWSDDIAVDPPGLYDSFELTGARSERTFNELGRSLQTFFDTVWLTDQNAFAYQEATAFATQVKAKTSREYVAGDDGKSPSDGNGVNVLVGHGDTPHGCASTE